MADIWTEPVRGGYPDPRVLAFSGLETLRMGVAGLGIPPPMSYLTGLALADADEDHVVFTMPASDWFLSSQQQISVGAITMLADAALGSGVQLRLPPATPAGGIAAVGAAHLRHPPPVRAPHRRRGPSPGISGAR